MNWRTYGPIDQTTFLEELRAVNSPMLSEWDQILDVAGPHSGVVAGILAEESRYATAFNLNKPENRNPANLRPRGGSGFLKFPTYSACIFELVSRISDPNYAYAKTVTLLDLIKVYAPASDSNDPEQYVANILTRFQRWGIEIEEEPPVSVLNMTKGLIPMPKYLEAFVDVSRRDQSSSCRGYDNLGIRASPPHGLVLHRPQSAPNTSNEPYLDSRCCPALFDFEVLANGQAKRFARLGDFASGWANGRVQSPYGDALKYLEHFGWNPNDANRHWESCEVGGWFVQPGAVSHEDPISELQWGWLAQWIASRAHDYGITWETFPIIPAENNRSYLTWHQEWTIGTGKVCPGATLMNGTSALIARARAIMKAAQTAGTAPKPPVYAASELPDWWAASLADLHPADKTEDGIRYRTMRRNFRIKVKTTRRSRPDTTSARSGPSANVNELLFGERLVEAGGKRFILTNDGHYILESKVSPRVKLTAW